MNMPNPDFTPSQRTSQENTTFDMINALAHLCYEAEEAHLDLVSFHLNLAFEELEDAVMTSKNNAKNTL